MTRKLARGEGQLFVEEAAYHTGPDCILWPGARLPHGYGQIKFDGKMRLAHRVVYYLRHGTWPAVVRHTCDNPPCCNPEHLLAGTPADNSQDMVDRGRSTAGAKHPGAKLTPEDVEHIRRTYIPGTGSTNPGNGAALRKQYGISPTQLSRLVRGLRWGPA